MDRGELEYIWKSIVESGSDGQFLLGQLIDNNQNQQPRIRAIQKGVEALMVTSRLYFDKVPDPSVAEKTDHKESALIPLGELDTADEACRTHGFATAFADYVMDTKPVERKGWFFKIRDYEPTISDTIHTVGLIFWAGKEDGSDLTLVTSTTLTPMSLLSPDEGHISDFESSLDLVRTNLLQRTPLE